MRIVIAAKKRELRLRAGMAPKTSLLRSSKVIIMYIAVYIIN